MFADAGLTEMQFEVDRATGTNRSLSFTAGCRRDDGLIANRLP